MENVLQRNLITDWARKCIFRVSGVTNFENLSTHCQPWWHLCGFNDGTGLPKKNLDMSLKRQIGEGMMVQI